MPVLATSRQVEHNFPPVLFANWKLKFNLLSSNLNLDKSGKGNWPQDYKPTEHGTLATGYIII